MSIFQINIYAMDMGLMTALAAVTTIVVACLNGFFPKNRLIIILDLVIALAGLYGILTACVFGRIPTRIHEFVPFTTNKEEAAREMFMNVMLFIPFAQGIGCMIWHWARRRWWHHLVLSPFLATIIICFFISYSIELWQFVAGTGTGQLGDIICNSIGGVCGGLCPLLAHFISRWRFKQDRKKMGITIITGPPKSGKSLFVIEYIQNKRNEGIEPAGVIAPPMIKQGRNCGVDAFLLPQEEYYPLAYIIRGSKEEQMRDVDVPLFLSKKQKKQIKHDSPYDIDYKSLGIVNKHLRSLNNTELLVIDEVVPLAYDHEACLRQGVRLLDEARVKNAVLCMRPKLIKYAKRRWKESIVEIIDVSKM